MKADAQTKKFDTTFAITKNDESLIAWMIERELEVERKFRAEKQGWAPEEVAKQLKRYRVELQQDFRTEENVRRFRAEAEQDSAIAPAWERPDVEMYHSGHVQALNTQVLKAPSGPVGTYSALSADEKSIVRTAIANVQQALKFYNSARMKVWEEQAESDDKADKKEKPPREFRMDVLSFERYYAQADRLEALSAQPEFIAGTGVDDDTLQERAEAAAKQGKRFHCDKIIVTGLKTTRGKLHGSAEHTR